LKAPYLPLASEVVSTITNDTIPYISAMDLLVFKIHFCGERANKMKSSRDATDAAALLKQEILSGPLDFTPKQMTAIEIGLMDVITYSGQTETWWNEHLSVGELS
jgi:hypothetical protein